MYEQQDERIKKLELELSEVNKKLEAIRIAKEEQESRFATLLKEADEKQERRDKDTNEKQERRDKEASEKQERRDKEANEKQEQRDKHFFDMMEKRHTEVLSQIKSLDIRPTSPPARKESKLSITDVHNVQITLDSPKIRNDAALPKNISFK
jgi:DNA repair exonuclease SbcCD ATPase subunit